MAVINDLAIVETLNGGDLKIVGNDFAMQVGFGNMPYLALFGGNVEGSTGPRVTGEQAVDWWANTALFNQDSSVQMNSLTERLLMNIALTSASRITIKQTVEKDLEFMNSFAKVSVEVIIKDSDKVFINIDIRPLNNNVGGNSSLYGRAIFVWDNNLRQLGDFSFTDFNDDFYK